MIWLKNYLICVQQLSLTHLNNIMKWKFKQWWSTILLISIKSYIMWYLSVSCDRSWFSPVTPVFSINKTDPHDKTEILLKVVLNTITLTHKSRYKINTIINLSQSCFSSLTLFIKYIFDRNLQFLNHVIFLIKLRWFDLIFGV